MMIIRLEDYPDVEEFYAKIKELPTLDYLAIMYRLCVEKLRGKGLDDETYMYLLEQNVSTLEEQEAAYKIMEDIAQKLEDQRKEKRAYYEKLLERIIKGAAYLERTDISETDRKKGEKLYEQLCKEADEFRAISSDILDSIGSGDEPGQAGDNPQRVA